MNNTQVTNAQWMNDKTQFVIEFESYIDFEKIREKFKGQFDGSTMQMPIPDDAPAEIPRLILKSKDNKKEAVFSKSRFEFTLIRGDDDEINTFYKEVFQRINLQKIFWIGFVFGKIKETEKHNDLVFNLLNDEVKNTFFDPGKDNTDLTVRYRKVDDSDSVKKNVNIQITSAIRRNEKRVGNLLVVDINTKPKQDNNPEYDVDMFEVVFLSLKKEMKNAINYLKKYE